MRSLLFALVFVSAANLALAGNYVNPVIIELFGTILDHDKRGETIAQASTGEVAFGEATMPFSGLGHWKSSILVSAAEDNSHLPTVLVAIADLDSILPAGGSSAATPAEFFSGVFYWSPGKKFTVFETKDYLIEMKITPAEPPKTAAPPK